MNKLLIVLLAVCLVSAHAFVKRDAPKPSELETNIEAMKSNLEKFGKNISEQAAKAFDFEVIKKNINNALDAAKKTIEKFKPVSETKPAA